MEKIDTDDLTNNTIRNAIEVYASIHLLIPDIDTEQYEYDAKKIIDINGWNTSRITDMTQLFCFRIIKGKIISFETFNGDISNWDTSKVENMQEMFAYCIQFNRNIGNWNTTQVRNTNAMFYSCTNFNQNISCWNLKNCRNNHKMFDLCGIHPDNKPLLLHPLRILNGKIIAESDAEYLDRYNDRCDYARNRMGLLNYNAAVKNYMVNANKNLPLMTETERNEHKKKMLENPQKNNPFNPLLFNRAKIAHIASFIDKGPINNNKAIEDPINNEAIEDPINNEAIEDPINNDHLVNTKCYGSSCLPKSWWPWRGGKTRKKRKSKSKTKRIKYKRTRKN